MQHPSFTYFGLMVVAAMAVAGALILGKEFLEVKDVLDALAAVVLVP